MKKPTMKNIPRIAGIATLSIMSLVIVASASGITATNKKLPVTTIASEYIGLEKGNIYCLAKEPNVTISKLYLDEDDQTAEYEGEAYLNNQKIEFEINAYTGEITEWYMETESASLGDDDMQSSATTAGKTEGTSSTPASEDMQSSATTAEETEGTSTTPASEDMQSSATTTTKVPQSSTYIGLDVAKAIALTKVPGAVITEIYLENDDGIVLYDGEMKLNKTEYEFEIDAVSGAILEWELDSDDDDEDDDYGVDDEDDDDEYDEDDEDDEDDDDEIDD